MLELKNIKKTYRIGTIETKALDGISVSFPEKEFVSILGTSGSGKTTCLNIIGGLDRYDSGELTIKGKKTSDFKDKDWDAYRNNSIGFVFQSYNLIMHLSIVANVELGMTLSGVSSEKKHARALEVLEQVGLKEHLHKKPNQLSGGQMQRVAIARALANNPEILLCDEPTGALDKNTSKQIMDLIKEVANDRLVIIVTHNSAIAEKYSDRIIQLEDGKIVSDSKPFDETTEKERFGLIKTSMGFITALRLSFNNIRTKKGRTFLTAFASSIGIIGIAVILSLSTGFQKQIDNFQSDTMSQFPIIISQQTSELNAENIKTMQNRMKNRSSGTNKFAKTDKVYLYDSSKSALVHTNNFTKKYIKYIEDIDPKICSYIGYARVVSMNLLQKKGDKISPVTFPNLLTKMTSTDVTTMNGFGLSSYPMSLVKGKDSYLAKNYSLLAGTYPEKTTDIVLVIDNKNRVDKNVMKALGFSIKNKKSINFKSIIGTQYKIIPNDNYFAKTQFGSYAPRKDYEKMFDEEGNISVRIVGVVRQNPDVDVALLGIGIAYSDDLSQLVIDSAVDSDIVAAQKDSDRNIITMQPLTKNEKSTFISYLGGNSTPYMAMVYPNDFNDKEKVTEYLDDYNKGKSTKNQIVYTDLAGTMSDLTKGIMDAIALVLIAFAAISLAVSMIMICIITYTSVLERTKEIGILRALGARKKDITRVFDAETFLLGLFSGVLGIAIAYLLTIPINVIIKNMADISGVANLQPIHAVILVAVSTVLTVLGGHIPAKMASRKDAVEALRSE